MEVFLICPVCLREDRISVISRWKCLHYCLRSEGHSRRHKGLPHVCDGGSFDDIRNLHENEKESAESMNQRRRYFGVVDDQRWSILE
jgi:hypothetical protein